MASWGRGKTAFIVTASFLIACKIDLYIVPNLLLAAKAVFVSTTGSLCPNASSLGSVNMLLDDMYLYDTMIQSLLKQSYLSNKRLTVDKPK